MGAPTSEMYTIPLSMCMDMRKVNTAVIGGELDEQQAAASQMVKKGVRIVKVLILGILYSMIFMSGISFNAFYAI
jgi:hypothetical protein